MSTPREGDAGCPRKHLSMLALVALLIALPICMLTGAGFAYDRVFATTSRVPVVLYAVFALMAVAAVPAAIVASRRIARSGGALRGDTLAATAILFGVLGVLAALALPRLVFTSRDMALYRACKGNLQSIGEALLAYSGRHAGQFPPNLQTLVDGGLDATVFICPTRPRSAPSFDPRDVDATGDYVYATGLRDDDSPLAPLVWDRRERHDDRVVVLFVDAHVGWISAEKLREELERSSRHPDGPEASQGGRRFP